MSQKKAGILITYITMAVNIVVGLVYSPFMLKMIGDSQYGVYSISSSLISFIALLDLGLGQTLVRYISKARALNDTEQEARLNGFFFKLYSLIAIAALFIGAAIALLYPLVCKKTMSAEEIHLFRTVFAILLVNVVFSFPMCVFSSTINAHERFFFLKLVNLITVVLKYLCMFLLLKFGYKVVSITIVAAATSIIMQCVYAAYCKKSIKIRFSFKGFDKGFAGEIFWFSFYIFLNLIIDFLYNSTDKLILGAVAGTTAVTVYSFGIYFQSYFQELSTAMSGVFLPSIVGIYEKEHDMKKISDLFLRVGRLQMAILVLVLGGYTVLGRDFINLWIGKKYADSYYIGLIIMLPALIPLTQNIGISVLRAMNLHKYRSYMYLAIAVINVAISIPLAKAYGGKGAAIGTCLATVAGQIVFMNIFYAKRVQIDIKAYWGNLFRIVLAVVPLVLVTFVLKKAVPADTWLSLAVYVAAFSVCYCIVYYFIIANEYEKDLIKNMKKKLIKRG